MTSASDQDHVAAGNGGGVAALDPDEVRASPARTVPWLRIAVIVALVVVAIVLAYVRAGSSVVVVQAVTTGILIGGVYGLVAMGLTLIFGVLDIVNFAHGSFLALALFLTFGLTQAGLHVYLALAISVPAMFLLGVLVQRGILAGAMGKPLENQLLITLGISLIIENALLLFFGANPRSVALSGDRGVPIFEAVANLSRILAFVGALLLAGLLYLLLQRTRLGTAIRAVAANDTGAQLVGIDTRVIYAVTFALGTACAGAAGTLVAPLVTIEPTTGSLFNIVAFVVVVLGGMGNVVGALVGGLIIGLAEQLGGIYLPGQSPLLSVFIVFVLVLFLRPQGLFRRSA
ncbi:branched-chain amino acid transport system permease protein [Asanoa hainanensis]|uniref:Branched-chain amino acid transport system permease protein n=1 Tax=Asanoa hainanensis TaxID=560556 RepID=A0A239NJM2_9ACTN|nr:branched-chain amino acid ABC transporter permease [Asanoa hainanensis]SNT55117.1 branched-chain amino acid transport system permease protein [Asanoa hainanensis]